MHTWVPTYVCVHMYLSVCVCARALVCPQVCVCACSFVHVHMCRCVYALACLFVGPYVCVCVCALVCTCMFIYCVCACTHLSLSRCLCVCALVCVHMFMFVCVHVHTCVARCVCAHACTMLCMFLCVCISGLLILTAVSGDHDSKVTMATKGQLGPWGKRVVCFCGSYEVFFFVLDVKPLCFFVVSLTGAVLIMFYLHHHIIAILQKWKFSISMLSRCVSAPHARVKKRSRGKLVCVLHSAAADLSAHSSSCSSLAAVWVSH